MPKEDLIRLAAQFSFEVEFERPLTKMVRFKRDYTRIDVWQSGTVGIYENKEQRYIRNVPPEDLAEIFANPNVTL